MPFDSEIVNKREKFINAFGDRILSITNFDTFINHLMNSVVVGWKNKIIASNRNKAISVLDSAICDLKIILSKEFEPLELRLSNSSSNTISKINNQYTLLNNRIVSFNVNEINQYKLNLRERLYSVIEEGIDDETFKHVCKGIIKEENTKLENSVSNEYNNLANDCVEKLCEIIERSNINSVDILNSSIKKGTIRSLGININVDNNFSIAPIILTTGAGICSLCIGVVNPAVLAGIVTSIISSILKGIYDFFRSKKSKQREAADRVIEDMVKEIDNSIKESKKMLFSGFEPYLNEAKEKSCKTLNVVRCTNAELNNVIRKLEIISIRVKGDAL